MMKKTYQLISVLLLIPFLTIAQSQYHTFTAMPSVAQSMFSNVAIVPKYNVTVGIFGVGQGLDSPFSYQDALDESADGTSATLNADRFLGSLEDTNDFGFGYRADLFFASVQVTPSIHAHAYLSQRGRAYVNFPKKALDLVLRGNQAVGQDDEVEGNANFDSWIEYGVGVNYKYNEKWTWGLRLKLTEGIFGGKTNVARASFKTEKNVIKTSVKVDAIASAFDTISTELKDKNYEAVSISDATGDLGIGVDIGATYQLNEKITFGLAINDIGRINYGKSIRYTIDDSFDYKGADAVNFFKAGDLFGNLEKQFKDAYELKETAVDDFSSTMVTNIYLTGDYAFRPDFHAGAVIYSEPFADKFIGTYSIYASKDFGRILSTSLSISRLAGTFNNFGAGISLNFPVLQIYATGDNLLNTIFQNTSKESSIDYIKNFKHTNFRFGLNIVFGWKKKELQLRN